MQTTVSYELKPDSFRQNYVPDPSLVPGELHWMLDFPAGRDLLKARQRQADSRTDISVWANDSDQDARLDPMIDLLGLRDTQPPVTPMERLKVTAKFFGMMVKCQFS